MLNICFHKNHAVIWTHLLDRVEKLKQTLLMIQLVYNLINFISFFSRKGVLGGGGGGVRGCETMNRYNYGLTQEYLNH